MQEKKDPQTTHKLKHLMSSGVDGDVDIFTWCEVSSRDGLNQQIQTLLWLLKHWTQGSHFIHTALGYLMTHITYKPIR